MSLARLPSEWSSDDEGARISDQEVFEALSNERRRCVVRWLLSEERRTNIRALSRQIAAQENDKPVNQVSPTERRRVYNALQQFHLPKLDELGFVRYDLDRGVIESTNSLDNLRPYLSTPRTSQLVVRFLPGALRYRRWRNRCRADRQPVVRTVVCHDPRDAARRDRPLVRRTATPRRSISSGQP